MHDLIAAERAALQRAVVLSAEVEIQLTTIGDVHTAPIVALLSLAREHAAVALSELAFVDLNSPKAREYQNDVRCFQRIVEWLRQIVADGFEAETRLDRTEHLALVDEIVGQGEDQALDDVTDEGATE